MNIVNILSYITIIPFLSGMIATLTSGHHYKNTRIPVILFHSILPNARLNLSHYPLAEFKQFLHLLNSNKTTPITVESASKFKQIVQFRKKCVLTFDDGLENVFTYAIPVLNKYNFKSTVFCVAGFCGKKSTWDVYKESRHLNKTQIKQISDCGHEIGSHSLTHADLTLISNKNLIEELRSSKRILEDITGKPVTSLSFPHGSWNKRVWDCAREQEYKNATLYRGHLGALPNMFPAIGATRFDSSDDIVKKCSLKTSHLHSIALSRITSHFAKGTPLWKFRENYHISL